MFFASGSPGIHDIIGLLMKTNSPDFQKNPDKTFVFNLTLTKEVINKEHQTVLKEVQADFETKGFRKGKAPLDLVKSSVSETKIIEEILSHLVSHAYQHKVEELKLQPVIQPQIKVLNPPITFDKDWQVELTGCELPELKLDPKYIEDVKKVNALKLDDNEKLNQTIEALVKYCQVTLPEILIKADMDNKLGQLIDQTQSAGITVVDYLKSKGTTLEKYQEDLKKQIHSEWTVNLAIDSIARAQKLEVTEAEVKEIVAKNPQLAQNLNLVYYLLTQQKVFGYLKKI